jgi:ATP-dependent Zn protease
MAEEMFYTTSVTTGAINDFEEAFKLAEKMIVYYGMGKQLIYPQLSEKYKEMIDTEVATLISDAYTASFNMLIKCKPLMEECAKILKRDKILKRETIINLIHGKYSKDFNYQRFEV